MIRGVPVESAGGKSDGKRVVVCDLLHDSVGVLLKVCVCVCVRFGQGLAWWRWWWSESHSTCVQSLGPGPMNGATER